MTKHNSTIKKTILIIDDSLTVRMSLSEILANRGYEVVLAPGGNEGLEILKSAPVDVVLLDLIMPEIDGLEVLRTMRTDEAMASLPVLLLTAMADIDSLVEALDCGASDYVVKPWTERDLLARIRSMVRLKNAMDDARKRANELQQQKLELEKTLEQLEAANAQLFQSERLEAVGRLAAGIAHEINTPTQFVGDNTRFVRDSVDDLLKFAGLCVTMVDEITSGKSSDDSVAAVAKAAQELDLEYFREEVPLALAQSLDGIDRVSTIVRAMKQFSHPTQDKQAVELNDAIQSTLIVATNEWKFVADLETDFDKNLPLVVCVQGEFNQVILNMVVNAAHAIADGRGENSSEKGVIKVSTAVCDDWAEIRIADSGAGMSEAVKAHIFDQFYTTKEVGRGTGQGLSIAYDVIVKKHEGTITVDSEPGKGSCFTIRLPLDAAAQSSAPEAAAAT